jgi:hypothetical protein
MSDRHFNPRDLVYVDKCVSPEKGIFSGGNIEETQFSVFYRNTL